MRFSTPIRMLSTITILAAVSISTSTLAATAAPVIVLPSSSASSVAIAVSGQITPRCTVDTKGGAGNFGNITNALTGVAAAMTLSLPFSMACNSPFEAQLISKNGALLYEGAIAPNFAADVNYVAALDMQQIVGGVSVACNSADMLLIGDQSRSRCHAVSSKTVSTANGDGHILLTLKPGILPLQMGTYSDNIVLRLTPRVSG